MVAGEFDHIRDDQRIDPFLLAFAVDETEAKFDIRKPCERSLFEAGRMVQQSIVPVNSQQVGIWSETKRAILQCLDDRFAVKTQPPSLLLLPCQSGRALGIEVARIDEDGDLAHE